MARDRRGAEKTGAREVMGDEANSQAFVALFHRYFDPIYRYCYHRLPTVEDAEDAPTSSSPRRWRNCCDSATRGASAPGSLPSPTMSSLTTFAPGAPRWSSPPS